MKHTTKDKQKGVFLTYEEIDTIGLVLFNIRNNKDLSVASKQEGLDKVLDCLAACMP